MPAVHVAHIGKSGMADPELWQYAFERDQVVITINAADFLWLARESELHAGLIVLRAQGLSRDEQWAWIEPVIDWLLNSHPDLTNEVLEVTGPGKFTIRAVPE